MAFTRWVLPHPDGPKINIGLNCVLLGCSTIASPTERDSLLLLPSMNVRNVWLGFSCESICGNLLSCGVPGACPRLFSIRALAVSMLWSGVNVSSLLSTTSLLPLLSFAASTSMMFQSRRILPKVLTIATLSTSRCLFSISSQI